MLSRSSIAFTLPVAFALVLPGCGGSSDPAGNGLSYRQQVARAQKEPLPDLRAKKLIRIAYGQAKAKDTLGAEETLRLAVEACGEIPDAAARAGAFSFAAEVLARIGNGSKARAAMADALAAAGAVEDTETKALTLARVGRAQGAMENLPAAVESLKRAEDLVAQLEDLVGKTLVLDTLAMSYQRIGREAESDRVITTALELAKTIEDDRQRCQAIAAVAARLSTMKKNQPAEQAFDLALQTAGKIDNLQSRTYALADVAEKLSKSGDHARTHKLLDEAEKLALKIPQPDQQRLAVEKIRGLMRTLPRPPRKR